MEYFHSCEKSVKTIANFSRNLNLVLKKFPQPTPLVSRIDSRAQIRSSFPYANRPLWQYEKKIFRINNLNFDAERWTFSSLREGRKKKKSDFLVPQVCCIEFANLIKFQVKFAPKSRCYPDPIFFVMYTRALAVYTTRFCFAFASNFLRQFRHTMQIFDHKLHAETHCRNTCFCLCRPSRGWRVWEGEVIRNLRF